jgi:DNA-binding response OmpR family regulator
MGVSRELIGQILISRFGIDASKVDEALNRQKTDKRRLCSLLMRSGATGEEVFARALGRQLGVPSIVLSRSRFMVSVLSLVPKDMALRERVLPISVEGEKLLVAAVDPYKPDLCNDIEFLTGKRVIAHVAVEASLLEALEEAYKIYSLSTDGVYVGHNTKHITGREQILDVIMEEMAVPEFGGHGDQFVVISNTDDIENIVSGRGVADTDRALARILVVDDEQDILELMKKSLSAEGYEVMTAQRGGEALQKIKTEMPDLVVLDAMLPEVHGFDICQNVKSSDIYRDIPILMISAMYTGWRFEEDIKKVYGADDYMTKPFRLAEVVRRIKLLLAKKRGESQPTTQDVPVLVRNAYNGGVKMLKDNKLDSALAEFRRGLAIDPFSYRMHYGVAIVSQQMGKMYEAMGEYEKTIELKPGFFPALKNLAIIYQQKGFRRKALETWERAMEAVQDEETKKAIREHIIALL